MPLGTLQRRLEGNDKFVSNDDYKTNGIKELGVLSHLLFPNRFKKPNVVPVIGGKPEGEGVARIPRVS